MFVNMILARNIDTHAIGNKGELLYKIPEDMAAFKKLTTGNIVIMGKTTFNSIGKPLKGRINIVMTRDKNFSAEGVIVLNSVDEVKYILKYFPFKNENISAFIIGGATIYKLFTNMTNVVYCTDIKESFSQKEYDTIFNVEEEFASKNLTLKLDHSSEKFRLSNTYINFKFNTFSIEERDIVESNKEPNLRDLDLVKMVKKIVEIKSHVYIIYAKVLNDLNGSIIKINENRKGLIHGIHDMEEVDLLLSTLNTQLTNTYNALVANILNPSIINN